MAEEIKKRIFDKRNVDKFTIDDEFEDYYASVCGWKAQIVYSALCRYASKDQTCFPSISTLAERKGVSRDTILEGLRILEEWNIIMTKKIKNKNGIHNEYILLDKSVWNPLDKVVDNGNVGNDSNEDILVDNSDLPTTEDSRPQQLGVVDNGNLGWSTVSTGSKHSLSKHSLSNTPLVPHRGKTLEELIEPYRGRYGPGIIEDFLLYWTEENQKGIQRWKTEKTWETQKRLTRWMKNQDKWDNQKIQRQKLKQVDEQPVQRMPVNKQIDTGFSAMGEYLKSKL